MFVRCLFFLFLFQGRGFGTVRFSSKEEAEAACSKLNDTDSEGRTILLGLIGLLETKQRLQQRGRAQPNLLPAAL